MSVGKPAEHEETIGQFSQGLTVRLMLIDDSVVTAHHLAPGTARLYCQDTTSVHLARFAVYFQYYFCRFTSTQPLLAIDFMSRLIAACLSM
ncbi:hypothetical protein CspeluHIS016_0406940 [Cutaneotrichosporon spelunceum]|uniref:Uncharacterized protein n=1 Tax=Cutaneotrichosporon spelunceum TaxID=1672016 RepID=A0AAD3YC88_9TREE|nr:hypothetical protein CspeluHIS016_0406940 [Cutaneotrichosporon spelunceum]